jgi:hypothetical protein
MSEPFRSRGHGYETYGQQKRDENRDRDHNWCWYHLFLFTRFAGRALAFGWEAVSRVCFEELFPTKSANLANSMERGDNRARFCLDANMLIPTNMTNDDAN